MRHYPAQVAVIRLSIDRLYVFMIKVTTGEQPKQESKPFPKLMILDNDVNKGTVVLFSEENKGMVILGCGNYTGKEGLFTSTWNMKCFTDYNEPITIQNI